MSATNEIMESNPGFTYGMAVGFDIGRSARARGKQFEGISKEEWRTANDDYAVGYRKAFHEKETRN